MPISYRLAARDIASLAPAVEATWPARGCMPARSLVPHVRRAEWPTARVEITIGHSKSVDSTGWHRPDREQVVEVLIVPETWLRALAELGGWKWSEVCRGIVEPQ